MFAKSILRLNNFVTKLRRPRVKPENLLLLFPHCLQWSECPHNILHDINNCQRCGKCPVKGLLALSEKYGIQCRSASGGRQAVAYVKRDDVKAIVAIACEKELSQGVLATLPKPIVCVPNAQPCGFCHNTTVDVDEVEKAVRRLLAK